MFILPGIVAFVITAFATPLLIPLLKKFKLTDNPRLRPHPAHVHFRTVPRAGGLPIFIALVISILLFIPLSAKIVGILSGLSVLLIIGLLDDRYPNFSPYTRLGLLFLAAAFPVLSGIHINFVTNPFFWMNTYIQLDQNIFIANFLSFIWIVTITQVINWSKGVDGQMPGITLVGALTLGFLSYKFYAQGDLNQLSAVIMFMIVAGSSLGFLIYNWYPAKIFPGFSGSTILAFMLAVLSIMSGAKLATAILVLGIPSADFIYTFFRRILEGKSPVWGDRGHLHHKLLDLGWSHARISLFYILGSAILGILALSIDFRSKAFLVLGVLVVILGAILWLNSFGALSKPSDPDNG